MKATLTFQNGDVLKYDDDWQRQGISAQVRLVLQEAEKAFSDPRHQIDYLIEKYQVKMSDVVPPEPLPLGAIG